ncbi:unnamed protein product [Brachionus calyciflorus]|uniref:Uncharacterized protein n=1 Tax=Brachionus calyciflorus TaxID=104777 RepID=A0A814KVT0_9BILA|nr:unnamed protein product [Brachionus calyciflorus]
MSQHRVATPTVKVPLPIQVNEKKEKFFEKTAEEKKKEHEEALNKLLKDCVREWCENTTSHGFANMVRTDSWIIRIIWLILVIIFMGYCIYTVVQIILTYFSFSVVVSYQVLSDSPSPFPAVTICNLNPFDVATENTTGAYINYALKANSITPNISISGEEKGITLVQQAASILRAYATADRNLTDEDRKSLGFTMDTMLVSCFYNHEECNTTEFSWFYDSDYGNCYTFNDLFDGNHELQNTVNTSKAGPDNGLKMELFVGLGGSQDYYTIKKGVKVVVHKRGVRPLLKYDGIEISTGTSSNIAISRTNYTKEQYPYSDCRPDPDTTLTTDSSYHIKTLQISKYYKKLCFEICLQYEQIIPNCLCADPSIPSVDSNMTICNNETALSCVKSQRDIFDKTQNIDDVCGPFCPSECNTLDYSTSISSSSYPTDYYGKILMAQSNLITKFNPKNTFSPDNKAGHEPVKHSVRRKRQGPGAPGAGSTNQSTTLSPVAGAGSTNQSTTLSPVAGAGSKNQSNTLAPVAGAGSKNQSNTLAPGAGSGSTNSPGGPNPSSGGPNKRIPSTSDIQSTVLMLSIYYDDLKYTNIVETPSMSLDTMMGLIGGQFGLYMGASFLSFVEILEMMINLGRLYAKYKNKKKMLKLKIQQIHD